ncbi:3-dehydroquinate dehydratase [Pedobacter sp. AK017]|uniref:hypothetical protein n=1 Tax=Pedobacter sp. AK017 TaxID=2723073 RepID=UPI001619E998|nr:hypothetical protein [Pedobacter sp. AK017]MBB5438148.1 3-dehydroquinate dehydratase [Pedobacter sp. AK017]
MNAQHQIHRMALFRRISTTCKLGVGCLLPACLLGLYTYRMAMKAVFKQDGEPTSGTAKINNPQYQFINF